MNLFLVVLPIKSVLKCFNKHSLFGSMKSELAMYPYYARYWIKFHLQIIITPKTATDSIFYALLKVQGGCNVGQEFNVQL